MSASRPKVNLRSTAVKRIMQEASELADPQHDDFVAAPLEDDIFEWHCTMRGVSGSEFEGGLYHLRILLPPSYPMAAPDIMLLTPNGRFELGKKICIDGLTSFHAGSWQPAWGVRTAITGLRSFWMQGGEALSAIGAVDFPKEERKRLAKISKDWVCPTCQVKNSELLPVFAQDAGPAATITASSTSISSTMPTMPTVDAEPAVAQDALKDDDSAQPVLTAQPVATIDPSEAENQPATLRTDDSLPLATVVPAPDRPQQTRPTPTAPLQPRASTATTHSAPTPQTRNSPLWIDVCLVALVAILMGIVARRLSQT